MQDSLAATLFQWCLGRRQQGLDFDLDQALVAFAEAPEAGAWLDGQRHVRFQDPRTCLVRALEALPGNQDQVKVEQADSLDDLTAFQSPIRISPQD